MQNPLEELKNLLEKGMWRDGEMSENKTRENYFVK